METAGSAVPSKIGKYEVLGVIGRGGMGVVYRARDPFIDRVVAVKTIRIDAEGEDDQLGRLRMEARSAGKLHHPNIVTIYDFGEEQSLSYIVMEFVEGINLARVVNAQVPIPLSARLPIVLQIARGLAYAHESGVVHRDMKPSNICVTARGVPKILDFGLARFDNTRLTKTGYLSGTIAYMSPERFSGDTGPQDDIFALGAVAYEFLTYRRAFPGDTTPEIIGKILGGPMPPLISTLTGYPAGLDEVILRALARDPAERYSTAALFVDELEKFARSEGYREHVAAEPPSEHAFNWMEGELPPSPNPYSSGRSMASVPMGGSPTLQLPSENIEAGGTEVSIESAEPTLLRTKPHPERAERMEKTVIVSEDRRRSRRMPLGAVIALVLVILAGAAFLIARNRQPVPQVASAKPAPPPAATVTTVTAPPIDEAASRQSEVQLAKATTLADLVAQRPLSPSERARFDDANRQLESARARIAEKDYAGGAALASQASLTLRDLLASNNAQRPVTTTAAARPIPPPRTATVVARTETQPPPPVAVATQPAVVTPPPAQVQPVTQTAAPPPPKPSRADFEREIHAFIRDIASAYQDKNVGFFRQRSLNFNDQLASAIRKSPSTRVDIAVRSIQFTGDDEATVAVRRTDTFAESGLPPGVQNLVYELRRTADGWKIVRFSRTAG